MSEEEKRAIKFIKYDMFKFEEIDSSILEEFNNVHKIILNLIKKQQDTLISQEKIIMEQEKQIQNYKKQVFGDILKGNYISKDKIRDKIKELKQDKDFDEDVYVEEFAVDILKELLED